MTGHVSQQAVGDDYVRERRVTELFESLTAALAFRRPEEPVDFLLDCLDTAQRIGYRNVFWDSFIPELSTRSQSIVTDDVTTSTLQKQTARVNKAAAKSTTNVTTASSQTHKHE